MGTFVGSCLIVKQLVPNEQWTIIAPLLPPEPPKLNGSRPRGPDRVVLAGIIYVLKSGIPWRMLPKEFGCSGVTCWRRLRDWQRAEVWHALRLALLDKRIARTSLVSDRSDCTVLVWLDDDRRLDVMIRSRGMKRLLMFCETK